MTDIIGGTPNGAANDLVKDATIETFQKDVLEASMAVPVVVDFWAAWCGPCKTLGPILEKEVNALGGKVRMVKVDTDQNQMLAQQLRIQSLPTVMAFVGGQPVDGFMGALPESQVKDFLNKVIQMAEQAGLGGQQDGQADAGAMVELGDKALEEGDMGTAIKAYATAAEQSEAGSDIQVAAIAGMARCELSAGNTDQAERLLDMIPEDKKSLSPVAQAYAQLKLSGAEADPTAVNEAKSAVEAAPEDPAAHYQLGEALADYGDTEGAMTAYLKSIELDREWNEGSARQKLLTVFDALGPSHDAVKTARRRLSSLLFS